MTAVARFSGRVRSPREILELIAEAPTGRKVLDRFTPTFESGLIRIEAYPLHIVEQLRQHTGPDQPIGACFMRDGKQGTIYLDMTSPLGVLAPFLLHEMVHSLDSDLEKASKHPMSRKDRDALLLLAETEAFEAQHDFVEELSSSMPGYRDFLNSYYPKARILHERLTTEDVAELYGFKTVS
jgi:hypothetical protein